MALDPSLLSVLSLLRSQPHLRQKIPAPRDRTVVYSGGLDTPAGLHAAWRMLSSAKAREPSRFDYVTLEERLRQLHVPALGESLFEHANRVSSELAARGKDSESMVLWRALSGIYVQGAAGRVRMLILPGSHIQGSVFGLTEVHVLLRPHVLEQIEADPDRLRGFRIAVRAGLNPAPIVVM